jgi:hypothetical protein
MHTILITCTQVVLPCACSVSRYVYSNMVCKVNINCNKVLALFAYIPHINYKNIDFKIRLYFEYWVNIGRMRSGFYVVQTTATLHRDHYAFAGQTSR